MPVPPGTEPNSVLNDRKSACERSFHQAGVTTPPRPLPVLVVEHDVAIRRFVAAVLRLAGYDVVETSCTAEAMAALAQHEVCIVVCDHRPTDMAGVDFVRLLRSRLDTASLPVIVLLSEPRLDLRVGALDSGADSYVVKPIDAEVLVAKVQAAVRPMDSDLPS